MQLLRGPSSSGNAACDENAGRLASRVNPAAFDELSELERRHFYQSSRCGEMVDKRQLDDVLFYETDHKPRPDIQYDRSVRIDERFRFPNPE